MGALCVQKQPSWNPQKQPWSNRRIPPTQQATSTSYYYKISAYVYHYYGKPITTEIQQWVQKSYSPQFQSHAHLLSGQTISSGKSKVLDGLRSAHQKGYKSGDMYIVSVDKSTRTINYTWIIYVKQNGKSVPIHYQISSTFDDQDRYVKSVWKQYEPQKPRPIIPYKPPAQSKPVYEPDYQSSNQCNWPPPPQRDYGAEELQRQQQQFRKNMNRQAQEWNDYARQKNQRGY